ncbi:hypothetical protein GP486_001319 [Trichoglossum hirsutum]|uniref:Velvet domain-containing protein n=1 Tax=Trichoglossum hirsutum TaxID=265104 RepID=A0A9P8LH97_9PEZI|nr:hypothetical protein GP486_001319 [Trichoglossum hirsutum]
MAPSQIGQVNESGDVNENETLPSRNGTAVSGSELFLERVRNMEASLAANGDPSFASCRRENGRLIYEFGILLQPKPADQPGVEIQPTIVALFRVLDTAVGEMGPPEEQSGRIWTYASAVDEDNPDDFPSFLDNGRVWEPIHPLLDGSYAQGGGEGRRLILSSYLTYSHITFRRPGRYRIRLHLMRMDDTTAIELMQIHTRPVQILLGAESELSESLIYTLNAIYNVANMAVGYDDGVFLRYLREQGVVED